MNTHLSQPTGAGALDGQHGMSFAISSVMTDTDMSSAIACIGASEGIPAMTGRETGANARPAIIKIASSRRMMKLRFTELCSHNLATMESHAALRVHNILAGRELISVKFGRSALVNYLSDRPITAISSDIFWR